jgi:excisionase family DNA binding protein
MNPLLSTKQLAETLGVSQRHIQRLLASGKLPKPKRIGRCVRWDAEEVKRRLDNDGNGERK